MCTGIFNCLDSKTKSTDFDTSLLGNSYEQRVQESKELSATAKFLAWTVKKKGPTCYTFTIYDNTLWAASNTVPGESELADRADIKSIADKYTFWQTFDDMKSIYNSPKVRERVIEFMRECGDTRRGVKSIYKRLLNEIFEQSSQMEPKNPKDMDPNLLGFLNLCRMYGRHEDKPTLRRALLLVELTGLWVLLGKVKLQPALIRELFKKVESLCVS